MGDDVDAKQESRVGVRESRENLTRYLNEARQGTSVMVTSRNVVIAEIRAPLQAVRPRRVPGALKGQIWMADDFDPWPADILDGCAFFQAPGTSEDVEVSAFSEFVLEPTP